MAKAFPSLILDTVLEQLESPIFQSKYLNCRLRIQLRALQPKLKLIREVVYDAELMAILFPNQVRECVCEFQRVLYELDDLLDEALTRRIPATGGMVRKAYLHFHNMPSQPTLYRKLKSMNRRLDCIEKEWRAHNLIIEEQPADHPQTSTAAMGGGSRRNSVVRKGILRYDPDYVNDDEFQMFGRECQKKKVISQLLDEDLAPTICIEGDVGAGKTTLCRAIYVDEKVRDRFGIRSWVSLKGASDWCSINFWKKIITKIGRPDGAQLDLETEDEELLRGMILGLIAGRKTLLVLDSLPVLINGLYEVERNLHSLRGLIADCHEGNKILFSAPIILCPLDICVLPLDELAEEDLWSIFGKNAFALGHDNAGQLVDEWKIAMGKKIVGRSGRNPALLRGVGTLLYGKDDRHLWEYFARDFQFEIQHIRYTNASAFCELSPKWQQPLGYLSLFSGNEIKGETLTNQLLGHGFAKSSMVRQQLKFGPIFPSTSSDKWDAEDTYAFFEGPVEEEVQRLVDGETAILEWAEMETDVPEAARHVSITRPSSPENQPIQRRKLPYSLIKDDIHRRSLLFLGELCPVSMSTQTLEMLASKLRYLRVLDLHDLALKMLPSSIGYLIHLKYLDLSRNDFKVLPESVCRLKHLWTLKLSYCDKLIKLPQRFKSLGQLKNLKISMCFDLTYMPSSIAKLTSLQSLDRFIVSPHKGGLTYLRRLDNLKGNLSIELPRQWERSATDVVEANLERKVGISALEFKWQGAVIGDEESDDHAVLEKLKPQKSIESLSIIRFGGKKLPSWIASLDFLAHISISQCTRCVILPPFHKMPHLVYLALTSMIMEYLHNGNSSGDGPFPLSPTSSMFFPSLEKLRIGKMKNLKGWRSMDRTIVEDELPRFPTIKSLEIWECPNLTMMPSFSEIQYQATFQDTFKKSLESIDWEHSRSVDLISIEDLVSLPNRMVSRLQCLSIKDCHQFQMLLGSEVEGVRVQKSLSDGFQDIKYLNISNCPTLKQLSRGLRHLTTLRYLSISKCSEELDCLYREDEDGMPWKTLQNLVVLKIKGFENLVTLPKGIRHLHPLLELVIKDCKALKHLSSSLRHLSNLGKLKISKCSEELDCLYKEDEDGMPWKALRKLKRLTIAGFEKLVTLPKDLYDLPLIDPISIDDCKDLKWEVGRMQKLKSSHVSQKIKELKREHKLVAMLKGEYELSTSIEGDFEVVTIPE